MLYSRTNLVTLALQITTGMALPIDGGEISELSKRGVSLILNMNQDLAIANVSL